jgi:hypothetical protein
MGDAGRLTNVGELQLCCTDPKDSTGKGDYFAEEENRNAVDPR